MSMGIRSLSVSGRYVPAVVVTNNTTIQGYAVFRCYSSRPGQFLTSAFLNQFLGTSGALNTLITTKDKETHHTFLSQCKQNFKDDFKESNLNQSFFLRNSDNISDVGSSKNIHVNQNHTNYCLLLQEFSQYSGAQSNEQLVFSNEAIMATSFSPTIKLIENWNQVNDRKRSFTSTQVLTKDRSKVRFSRVHMNAIPLKPETIINAPTSKVKRNKESNENLEHVYNTLSVDLPQFFVRSVDYKIYHHNIEFVNNIKGTVTRGMPSYVKQCSLLRMYGHLKYAYVKMEILRITMHTQDNTVRVRWRITGITGLKIFLTFWKYKFWKIKESLKDLDSWHDGYSTFYVNDEGLVYKHVVDKVIPSEDVEEAKPKSGISKIAPQLSFSNLQGNN